MDLTDRGVEGREPPKPLDVFLTTERGIYRVGETVYATALVRDATARAVENVPLTAIVTRPDGKEHSRIAADRPGPRRQRHAGRPPANAMRGTWRIGVYADVKGSPLAETTFLVEDFEPERLDFDLKADAEAIDPAAPGGAHHRRALPLRRAGRRPQHRRRDGAGRDAHARRLSGLRVRPCGRDASTRRSSRSPAPPPTRPAMRRADHAAGSGADQPAAHRRR